MPLFLPSIAIAAASVPTAALVVMAIPMFRDAAGLRRVAGIGRHRIEMSILVGRLVHEMQRERGLSVAKISNPSNLGESTRNLVTQRQAADPALERFLAAARSDGPSSGRGLVERDKVLAALAPHDHLRRQIDANAVTAAEVVTAYSGFIAALLEFSAATVRGASRGRLARLAMAYGNLLGAKERAGQERAVVSGALAAGHVDEATRGRVRSLMGSQDIYLRLFRNLVGADLAARLDKALVEADPQVAAIRSQVLGDGIPAVATWFAAASLRIDALKTVEDQVAEALLEGTAVLERRARRQPWAVGALVASSLAILGGVASLSAPWL